MEKKLESDQTKRRVKVYQLDQDSSWEDKGTGHVSCNYVERLQSLCLIVKSEVDGSTLLESKVALDDTYQLQQDTLIVWNDPETDADLALSFQEGSGCKEIWDQLCTIQKLNGTTDSTDLFPGNSIEEAPGISDLPPPNLQNLSKILQIITSSNNAYKREKLSLAIIKENYIQKLLDLFSISEDLEDTMSLHLLFQIFKALILLNETSLFDIMFADDVFLQVVGALEYDPELPKKVDHREFLKSKVMFKEVIPFESPEVVAKIHQTFRMQYLKDVILPRTLDDPTFATINSLIFFNHVELVSAVQKDERFLKQLFQDLKDKCTPIDRLRDLIAFVQELCNLAKNLQVQLRVNFYQIMTRYGLLDIIGNTIVSDDVKIRLSSVNILDSIVGHDPLLVRHFMLSQKPKSQLLDRFIEAFLTDPEMGIRVQLTEILRILIDTTNEEGPEVDEFLNLFYSDSVKKIMEPFNSDTKPESEVTEGVKEAICDILSFCVTHHGYRIKYFLLGNNVTSKVLTLLKSKQKHLVLAAIRFFRAFIGMKDDFYNRHFTKRNLFEPIIQVFKENGPKYNLLNSAIIELFEFIRKENIKHLIQHVVENYGEFFKTVEYVDTFKLLLLKYEQNQEINKDSSETVLTRSSSGNGSTTEKEEESEYFNTEEEETIAQATITNNTEEVREFKPLITRKDEEDFALVKKPEKKMDNGKHGKITINLSGATHSREGETVESGTKKRKT